MSLFDFISSSLLILGNQSTKDLHLLDVLPAICWDKVYHCFILLTKEFLGEAC